MIDRRIVAMWCVLLSVCFNIPLELFNFPLELFNCFFQAALVCFQETFLTDARTDLGA